MRVLLDTNVILDLILERKGFLADAEQIFEHLNESRIEIFLTNITTINVFYTTRKERDKATAFRAVGFLVDTAQFCSDNSLIVKDALKLNFSDYEDAVQCASAMAEGLDAIVTRNTKDYVNSPLPVYSPAEFLEVLRKEQAT